MGTESVDTKPRKGFVFSMGHVLTLASALLFSGAQWDSCLKDSANNAADIRRVDQTTDKRISALEAQGADKLTILVGQLAKSVDQLAEGQKADHDVLIRRVTALDDRARRGD